MQATIATLLLVVSSVILCCSTVMYTIETIQPYMNTERMQNAEMDRARELLDTMLNRTIPEFLNQTSNETTP